MKLPSLNPAFVAQLLAKCDRIAEEYHDEAFADERKTKEEMSDFLSDRVKDFEVESLLEDWITENVIVPTKDEGEEA